MKRIGLLFLVIIFTLSFINISAIEKKKVKKEDILSRGFLKNLRITGEFKIVTKYQKAFATPLDTPSWGVYDRASANYRASENFRAVGNLNFSLGKMGQSKWFGVLQMKFDANDPDVEHDPSDNEDIKEIVELDNFFIMYRPFKMNEGRPLGISAGVMTIPATANAAYTHYFTGDVDEDFIFYTASALTNTPMAQIDFHIDENTGVGFSVGRGAGDISKIGTGMNENSALNKVVWMEAQKWNFGLNSAVQFVSGEGGGTKLTMTEEENAIYEYDGKYKHTLINGALSYKIAGLKPYIGYIHVSGDEVPSSGNKARTISGNFQTIGLNIDLDKIGMFGKLYADYTVSSTPDFDGLNGLPEGTLAQVLLNSGDSGLEALAPNFTSTGGNSECIYAISNFDSAYHFEYSFNMKDNLKLTAFYYELMGKNDNTMSNAAVEEDIAEELTPYIGASAGPTATALMAGLTGSLDDIRKFAEWTHTYSLGLAVTYSF